ncbi:baseplate J/gp47 family protein [Sorangium sp. So ce1151]|uniref:baseplate J/gp47 family protein n=1 Tax=Sorangium sp. So ce1151 TaxID=3133332 RepID=UPI003F5E9A3A
MPLKPPPLDDRKYQDLVDQALARIPVHTPEWTSFGKSDPGVTLIEVFAFLTESLLYRAKQIPERNRIKFLSLLGVPLQPASAAIGLVSLSNERGAPGVLYFGPGLEVRAGQVPFRTERGLEVMPVEAQIFIKQRVEPDPATKEHYELLYQSFKKDEPEADLGFYATAPFPPPSAGGLDLGSTIDRSIWIALLLREVDTPGKAEDLPDALMRARELLAGRTLNIGVVPTFEDVGLRLAPGADTGTAGADTATWDFDVPKLPEGGLPAASKDRDAQYQTIASAPPPTRPAIFEVTLPSAAELAIWDDLKPLESGTRDFPPAIDDKKQKDRVITWLRIHPSVPPRGKVLWVGINAAAVSQRARTVNEPLPDGNGEPDQAATLSRAPVLPDNVRLTVDGEVWALTDDLLTAGPEVRVPDPRLPPGTPAPPPRPSKVFQLDPEAGQILFGDGLRGARPPRGARILVDYDHGVGRAGNVGAGAIKTGPALPAGVKVSNPVPTWSGADAETTSEGEKQVTRWLQHRDRLVTVGDFEAITLRAPGVSVARVDVLPAFHPDFSLDEPGDAPGTVTLMVIPLYDPKSPDNPSADRAFLQAIADHLEPRRLVTTEVLLRGPTYRPIYVSIGIKLVAAGSGVADVIKAVEQAVRRFLSPLPDPGVVLDEQTALLQPGFTRQRRGWPLRQAVHGPEIAAAANRVDGVAWVNEVRLSEGGDVEDAPIPMKKLELPLLARLAVSVGQARPVKDLLGAKPGGTPPARKIVPVPVVPEDC